MSHKPATAAAVIILTSVIFVVTVVRDAQAEEESGTPAAEEFSFDVDEFKKSPWSLDGFLQGDLSYTDLNRGAAFTRISDPGNVEDDARLQGGLEAQAAVTYQRGPFKAYVLGMAREAHDGERWDEDLLLYEGHLSLQAGPNAYFTLGKTLLRWGKGYAWNPTNFLGRDKNPSDPDLALEGYWMALADLVKSYSGPLKTIALTTAVLPVSESVNNDFGQEEHVNAAVKLYFLLHDTDIDLMALLEGSRPASYGLTASRNVTSNIEIHGELALVADHEKRIVDTDGTSTTETDDTWSGLAGTRYLAPAETTYIVEYYHNGKGYTAEEVRDFFSFVDSASDSRLAALRPGLSGYQLPNFRKNYLYLKASQKEPFGWLYLTPALFSIINLDDGSFNLVPEIAYSGIKNLELRFRFSYLSGDDGTEYGEKPTEWRSEIRFRYYF